MADEELFTGKGGPASRFLVTDGPFAPNRKISASRCNLFHIDTLFTPEDNFSAAVSWGPVRLNPVIRIL